MYTRRGTLQLVGATVLSASAVGVAAIPGPEPPRIRKRGQSLLSDPPGLYAEVDVRSDGEFAVVGHSDPDGASFLVDLRDDQHPVEVHALPAPPETRVPDVKFDFRDGLYYRSMEPTGDGGVGGVDVVDYGFADGTPENPVVLARVESGPTHNVRAHPTASVLYATNVADEPGGLDVWDTTDPRTPVHVGAFGPVGVLHDVTVDATADRAHLAYIGGGLDGYVVMDITDPLAPREEMRFDYAGRVTPEEAGLGVEAFQHCHYALGRGDLAVVGDEVPRGVPGGKHVFDLSAGTPEPIGYVVSPNARLQETAFEWTGHNFDFGPRELLVSGDYREGLVVYDLADPTTPRAVATYETNDMAETATDGGPGTPPRAWAAVYNERRDFVVVSDMFTGIYVFRLR